MIDFGEVIEGYYTSLCLQFGYMVFFGIYFPFGYFELMIANIIIMALTAFAYSHHVKRSKSMRVSSIGIWKTIFKTLGYLGVIYNALVLLFPGNGMIPILGTQNQVRDVVLILMLEHFLIAFKAFIGSILEGMPLWVKRRIQKEKYLEERHHEKIIFNFKDQKN